MSSTLNSAASDPKQQQQHIDQPENPRHFVRTPRPYFHDGLKIRQDTPDHAGNESGTAGRHVRPQWEHGQGQPTEETGWPRRSGQASIAASESGTEADDERPNFVKALPPATLRPRKGLKAGEPNEDALLTPSQLDDEGRRLSGDYFQMKPKGSKPSQADDRAEQEKFLRVRIAEFVRRSSEVAFMCITIACVFSGRGVLQAAAQSSRELVSHVAIIAALVLAYPVKLSIVDTRLQRKSLWQRFRVPASFDPATVLYPTLLPILVALSVSPANPDVIMPNIILGLASLPQRLFPRSSRLGGTNVLHWLVAITPLILSKHTNSAFRPRVSPQQIPSEVLVLLYPLHHALLQPLNYLTTTSLLISELHLLSAALINLLLFAKSPQAAILKGCLWIGGVALFTCCGATLQWNVTLARVPRWKLRRAGHSAEERKSLVDAVSELIDLQRATAAFRSTDDVDSDADEDAPVVSIKDRAKASPKLATTGIALETGPTTHPEPKSAVEPPKEDNGFIPERSNGNLRPRRNTLPERELPTFVQQRPSARQKGKRKLLWCLQLTPEQALRRKWLYASWVYLVIVSTILGPIMHYVSTRALYGQNPFGWALGYLFGELTPLRDGVLALGLINAIPLPLEAGHMRDIALSLPLDINEARHVLGPANMRLLLIGYWAVVLLMGLLAVFSLTALVEVDTRRKVFHGVMVAMLLPSVFVDPCYCALALNLVLAVFLLLEVLRAGLVPPLGNAIGRFVAPYVDGRDLRGPVVVSHIFLLIGCAVPLWLSLASIGRRGQPPWIDWELADNKREVAMIAGVVCVGMGDAAASLIGRRYGRHKWMWVGGKSLEGSAAFVLAVTVGLIVAKSWQVLGGWNDAAQSLAGHSGELGFSPCAFAWLGTLVKAVFCACGASFMEAVLTGANDNVVVPIALWLLVKGSRL